MDINCVYQCFYQTEGKCTLNELPQQLQAYSNAYDVDCPYYMASFDNSFGLR